MPHVLLLGECLIRTLPMDSFDSISNTIVIDYLERIVHLFLSTHDPSQFMQYHDQIVQQPSTMALKMVSDVDSFPSVVSCIDDSWLSKFLQSLGLTRTTHATDSGLVTIPLQSAMISTIDTPLHLSSSIINSNVISLILARQFVSHHTDLTLSRMWLAP